MSCWIFKAERRFLYSLLLLAFSAYFTQANASVCFLPDATNCGTDSIINQCDGVRFFGKGKCSERLGEYQGAGGKKAEDGNNRLTYMTCSSAGDVCDELKCIWSSESACRNNADSSSSPDYHYECYWDADNGCWYQTKTPCYTYDDPDSNSSYPLDAPVDNMACKSNTWDLTHHKCTEKGIAYTEPGTRTTYDCVEIKTDVRGCSGYNLDAELPDYDCQSCETDVYKTDYYGNYNYSGKGNTVYSCSKTAGCSGYDLTASQKATKEASGDYRCHECTPTVTDSDGNTSSGTTVYKCGKITTSTTSCPANYISAAEADELKKDTCYSCTGCTPTTDYYDDGVWYNGTSGTTVYNCSKPDCTGKSKASDCGTGKEFVASGDCAKFPNGESCGDCIDCNDETNPINKCFGKYTCKENGRHGVGAVTCTCGNVPYYDRCEVEETCTKAGTIDCSDGACKSCSADTDLDYWLKHGNYKVGEKCKQIDLTPVYYYASCTGRDCNGNYGPAYGKKACSSDQYPGGDTVECGGYTYADYCMGECNYEDDAKSCADKGKTFVAKCHDKNDKEWGECQ